MNRIRVILADDHRLFRAGLRSILESQPGIEVVGEAVDGHAALTCMARTPADILLLDISMPGLNGIETLRRLTAEKHAIHVIVLSMHSDRYFISEAFKAGARGYLLKDSAIQEVVKAMKTVMRGEVYLNATIGGMLVDKIGLRKSSMLRGEACQPSPSATTRRNAPGLAPPIQSGGCGFCTGLGANPMSRKLKNSPSNEGLSCVHSA
jgi:DNA-binding NarL/FixJ family response regulator